MLSLDICHWYVAVPDTVELFTDIAAGVSLIQIVLLAVAKTPPLTWFSIIVKVAVLLHPAGVVTTTVTVLPSVIAPAIDVKLAVVDGPATEVFPIKN